MTAPRAVVQLMTPQGRDFVVANHGQKITYGLTDAQLEKLYRFTNGYVNLRAIYTVDVPNVRNILAIQRLPDYKGLIYPNVLPPAMMTTPDPALANQWWIESLGVKEAWKMATGKGITVADCDAGFYLSEQDLNSNMLVQYRQNFSDPDSPSNVETGGYIYHGTAVAAIIAGVLNGVGTNGIAYDSKIVPLQNYSYSSRDKIDKEEATARCILHAIKVPNVRIIVLENQTATGSSETYIGTREAVKLALSAGITIVSAGGNYTKELLVEQENDTGSIIVGALNPNGSVASFSNYGKRITTSAFGSNLTTLYGPNGKMGSFGGTSGATPQVAAAVAMMLEVNPKLLPAQIRQILEATRMTNSTNAIVGGQINIVEALRRAQLTRTSTESVQRSLLIRKNVYQILTQR